MHKVRLMSCKKKLKERKVIDSKILTINKFINDKTIFRVKQFDNKFKIAWEFITFQWVLNLQKWVSKQTHNIPDSRVI